MHEIWDSDNLLSVRQPTWHGLGKILPEYPSREEAQAIAHPWEPISEPVYTAEPTVTEEQQLSEYGEGWQTVMVPGTEYQEVPGFKAIRRSDNGDTLGVTTDGYEPVSNNEMWDIAEAIQGSGVDVQYETAGSLKGGRKVWVLIRLNDPLEIAGDKQGAVLPYYTLQNSHDGTGAFRGQATVTRIVCANTAQMADLDAKARGTEFTFRHTKNVRDRIEDAKTALTGWRQSLEDYRLLTEHLLTVPVTGEEKDEFVFRFIPAPPPGTASDLVMRNVQDARYKFWDVLHGPTNQGIEHTAQGLLAASIEYAEHYRRAHTEESRFRRSFLDRNQVVQSATKILQDVVTV